MSGGRPHNLDFEIFEAGIPLDATERISSVVLKGERVGRVDRFDASRDPLRSFTRDWQQAVVKVDTGCEAQRIWPQRHKDTEKKHGAPDAAPRSGGRGVQTANERPLDCGSVVRLRFARLTARPACRPTASSASVSQCLCGLQINTSAS